MLDKRTCTVSPFISIGLSVPPSQQDDITSDSSHLATEISQSDSAEDRSQSQLIGTDAVLSQQVCGLTPVLGMGA